MATETREFKLHKDILWSIIQSQAGTLGKAILELVMNLIDAGATKVDIRVSNDNIKVVDDGKGFADRSEIESFFETFGTPHQEGDAVYGRFRMGRGQIMAFSRNIWQSGMFKMDVNIRDNGLNYELNLLKKAVKGCSIEAQLYDVLKPSEVIQLVDAVAELCRYAPVPVLVNDKRVSLDLENEKWTTVDDNAYYSLRRGKDLDVYNLGVHVRRYPGDQFGVGGIIVSKKQLNVNFARNDILVSKCSVWKDISKVVKAKAKEYNEKKPVQDENWRANMLAKIKIADFENADEYMAALSTHKVLSDISGKHYSFNQLSSALHEFCSRVVSDYTVFENTIADKIHQYKLGFVLSQSCINRMGQFSFLQLVERVCSNLESLNKTNPAASYYYYKKQIELLNALKDSVSSFSSLKDEINETCVMVDKKELNKKELCVYNTIVEMSSWLVSAVQWKDSSIKQRTIKICESETMDGFTDGESYIAIERKFLNINGNNPHVSFERIKYLLLHEYCHDSDDFTGHGHPAEFYEKYHNFLIDDQYGYLQGLAIMGCAKWIKFCEKAGLKIAHNTLRIMDVISAAPVEDKELEAANVDVLKVAAKVNKKEARNA